MLLGRIEELAAIDALLDDARASNSRTLILAGAPGIGKSALQQYARDAAVGMQVASVAGTESELDLVFAGLHRLLRPFLGCATGCPSLNARRSVPRSVSRPACPRSLPRGPCNPDASR